jgi:hypothetical protein
MKTSNDMETDRRKQGIDPTSGKQLVLLLFFALFMLVTGTGLWAAAAFYRWLAPGVQSALGWAVLAVGTVLVFNYAYLLALLGLRLIVPRCREGYFPALPGGRPPKAAVRFMMNIVLTMLRYSPPWAKLYLGVLAGLPPLNALYRRFFGPHTRSLTMGDTCVIFDPDLLYAGDNVQFGYDVRLLCHTFDRRGLVVKRIEIENDALIGGQTTVGPGVRIGHHAIVNAGSWVMPYTQIGPWELWGGAPAKKIRDLPHDAQP